MTVYRIEKEKYRAIFPPLGSLYANGRWHHRDMWVVYTSESVALAKLETLANAGSTIPKGRVLMAYKVSDDAPLIKVRREDLPEKWYAVPYPRILSEIVRDIIHMKEYVGIMVPSAQSFNEHNILLLPDHPEFSSYVKRSDEGEEYFDPRLR